ncbi:hypothetical protein ACIBAG_41815 [Streptomyces sp. NPDC051243]|uniref:hypothetical protein n=1 Tax=Streptomyces sp. NPDC051243 TaxID=3365646 RepID=UPI0037BC2625
MADLKAQPQTIEQGGRVLLTFELTRRELAAAAAAGSSAGMQITATTAPAGNPSGTTPSAADSPGGGPAGAAAPAAEASIRWVVDGIGTLTTTGTDTDDQGPWTAFWDVPADQQPSRYTARAIYTTPGRPPVEDTDQVTVQTKPFARGDSLRVHMGRTDTKPTDDQALWTVIRRSTDRLAFQPYADWINEIMCGTRQLPTVPAPRHEPMSRALPFPGVDAYLLLKVATEVFLLVNCGVHVTSSDIAGQFKLTDRELADELDRYSTDEPGGDAFQSAIINRWTRYVKADPLHAPAADPAVLPYLSLIRMKLGGQGIGVHDAFGDQCYGILSGKFTFPCFLELIHSYWHEEGMLTQSVDAIARRFQNIRGPGARDPLAHVEIDPLRALNPILWGYVQDAQHRLTALRRAHEYDHHYGINQLPPGAPALRPADSRPRFLEAFHTLLQLSSVFFREDDDTTVLADGFPVLNALKDVHLLLTEGQHNQYGDLPWTARQEMLMQQWILARPEMREFLPGRTMVAYPEPWMDRVDTMKRLQGWTPDTVIHFRDLGRFGEQLLLSVRFGDWSNIIDRNSAANWARYWRGEIQGYIHSYRSVTGVDLTSTPVDGTLPAIHLRSRLAQHRSGRRPALDPASPAALPAPNRRRAAPGLAEPRSVPQLPSAQRAARARPASLPPGRQGAPRLPGPEGR